MPTNDQKMSAADADALNKLYANATPVQQQSKYRPLSTQQTSGMPSVPTGAPPTQGGNVTQAEKYMRKAKWFIYGGPFIGLPVILILWAIISFLASRLSTGNFASVSFVNFINITLGLLAICSILAPVIGIFYFRKAGKMTHGSPSMTVHPWLRYWARSLDIFIAEILVCLLVVMAGSSLEKLNTGLLFLVAIFFWVFIESLLISTWGKTPGKWLFNIDVKNLQGEKPDFSSALNRSFFVWLKGLGMGLPIVSAITLVNSYGKLIVKGATSWDENQFIVTHRKMNGGKVAAIIIAFIAIVLLSAFASSQT